MKTRKTSDQIKTQHGTMGLLMAECEQLRRDLAQAKADSEWGKSLWDWLRDMLPDSALCLEIDTEDLMQLAQKHGRAKRVLFDPEIHGFIDSEPGHEIWWWGDDVAPKREAMNICKECERLKRDNARLAAALKVIEESKFIAGTKLRLQCSDALSGNSTALRDLLAPTIELFASMQDSGCSRRVQEELSRLRSIMERKPSD